MLCGFWFDVKGQLIGNLKKLVECLERWEVGGQAEWLKRRDAAFCKILGKAGLRIDCQSSFDDVQGVEY
jgi:hypothetical protein